MKFVPSNIAFHSQYARQKSIRIIWTVNSSGIVDIVNCEEYKKYVDRVHLSGSDITFCNN